ncbi:MraY family glycosyltransferase [Flammeovirga aprica]|uniref:Undecaprenyl/decaprenyl-phosphate alpha-N-acetylglucosaminyl 1-phosphate transferase n=1 Tax=Flammeovirga aprica JL-4 TaxID=694437 RepID=A0A7X9S134_9BACT|nr:MraY family glycosyltransferase [Flammeovirga aprica]NME72217.1 undecaprenyl/decaprenyl-phosphate alpha-N-acetylglucosaminyl 1-phosphate transferase [Flammeovirga aprica JL-4]
MLILLLSLLTSLTVSLIAVPEVRKVIIKSRLLDEPGGRKIHTGLIPAMGGVGIFLGFVLSFCLWGEDTSSFNLNYLFFGLILMLFMGIRDDMLPLSPRNKLIIQFMATFIVVVLGDVRISSLYTLFSGVELPLFISYAISMFVIIALTNSFNLIDGINGLSGSISTLISFSLGIWFYLVDEATLALAMFAMVGACLGFLYYNWGKAQIFMGDAGALFLGFFISISLIIFVNIDFALDVSNPYKIDTPISIAIALFIYPFIDTLRIFTIRILSGRSPFSPDKKHIHHILIRTGLTHASASSVIIIFSVIFMTTVMAVSPFFNDLLLLVVILSSLYFIPLLLRIRVSNYKENNQKSPFQSSTKEKTFKHKIFKIEKTG